MKLEKNMIRPICCLFLLGFICVGCKKALDTSVDFKSSLNAVYRQLSFARNGLDYPDQKQLASCKQTDDYPDYFFDQPEQDHIILDRLLNSHVSSEVLKSVTAYHYEWHYNRPDPQAWIEAIQNLPDSRLDKNLKEVAVEWLMDAMNHPRKFGLML